MRSTISKDQTQELRQALSRMRVDAPTIDALLTSWNSANTYKAFRQGKKIVTDDNWTIHFGAKWATPPEKSAATESDIESDQNPISPEEIDAAVSTVAAQEKALKKEEPSEDIASRTFKSLVSLIKKPAEKKPEAAPKTKASNMKRVIIEIDSEMLIQLKNLAEAEQIPVSALIRLAIRKYLS